MENTKTAGEIQIVSWKRRLDSPEQPPNKKTPARSESHGSMTRYLSGQISGLICTINNLAKHWNRFMTGTLLVFPSHEIHEVL